MAALRSLLRDGHAEVPTYSIAESRRTGSRTLDLQGRPLIIAEGIFALDLLPLALAAGLPVTPLYLDRDRTLVAALRLRRDLAQHRKPPAVLLRRGWALWRAQPAQRERAVAAGFAPTSMRAATRTLAGGAG
ncbi:uridine kinase [Propioniciclava coleopterorum]|uniref:uridine kinase n=1 Tax=Propioniciclava coleopterorum TaxID=2714937 RepID=UPI001FE4D426|nr:uridine kinase [Propioniciclava coleopterorum]